VDELTALAGEVSDETVIACGPPATTAFLSMTALAWELDVALGDIGVRTKTAPPSGVVFADADAAVREAIAAAGRPIGERGRWRAYAVSCASASGAAMAGVGGASR
jgi:hypothetical protein